MKTPGFKVLSPHDAALDYHKWILAVSDVARTTVVYRDKLGRRTSSAHYRWLLLRCNDTGCGATAILREDVALESLPLDPK